MSYFDGMRVGLYRETSDGRRVCARRSGFPWRKRWYYVLPSQERAYERRALGVHLASLGIIIALAVALADRVFASPAWFVAFFVAPMLPAFLYPTTAGLEAAHVDPSAILPRNAKALRLEFARAIGAPTLLFQLIASIVMAAGQLYVLVTDGAWWSWAGLAMFMATGVSGARQLLLLRRSDAIAPAS